MFILITLLVSTNAEPKAAFIGGWHWQAALVATLEGIFAITLSLLTLARFQQRYDQQRPLARALSRSAYGAFLAQAPILVGIALAMHPLDIPADFKFVLLAVGATAGSFATASLILRLRHSRPRLVGSTRRISPRG